MIPDAGQQDQAEQSLRECYEDWINDPQAQREYREWELRVKHAAWIADYAATLNEQEKEPEMVAFSSMSESKFLKKEDLDQQNGNLVTIQSFKKMKVSDDGEEVEYKYTVKFHEFEKPMVLNATNRAILEKAYGSDTDDCVGQKVVAYVDENISFQGKLVGGIRLRPPKTKPGAAKPAPKQEIPDPDPTNGDDEVPF